MARAPVKKWSKHVRDRIASGENMNVHFHKNRAMSRRWVERRDVPES